MSPGEILPADGPDLEPQPDMPRTTLVVANTGDRPIQVGSHFCFFEVNKALRFDRTAAYGTRLDIPAGTSVRFEPGDEREVTVVPLGGNRVVHGFGGLTEGALDDPDVRARALTRVVERGYLTTSEDPR